MQILVCWCHRCFLYGRVVSWMLNTASPAKHTHGAERFRAQGFSTRPRFVVCNLLILNKSTGVADVQRERQSQRERKLAFIMNVSSDNKAPFAYHNPNLSCSDQVRCEGIFFLVAFESLWCAQQEWIWKGTASRWGHVLSNSLSLPLPHVFQMEMKTCSMYNTMFF